MKKDIYIGIDPGLSGGIATWKNNFMIAYRMPETEKDVSDLLENITFMSVYNRPLIFCCIEKQHSFPGQGISSTFKLAQNYGFLRGMLIAKCIPFIEISPQRWQKYFNLKKINKDESKTNHKNRIKAKAQQLFPNLKITLATADAIMICEFARQSEK